MAFNLFKNPFIAVAPFAFNIIVPLIESIKYPIGTRFGNGSNGCKCIIETIDIIPSSKFPVIYSSKIDFVKMSKINR